MNGSRRARFSRLALLGPLAVLGLLAGTPLAAQSLPGAGFRADPVLDRQVQAMVQGPDGRMWLATGLGLEVYDGYEAVDFTGGPDSAEPFPRGSVRSLYLDGRGRLWVGHANSLVRIDPLADRVERVYRHDPEDPRSLVFGDVTAIHEDAEGRIWVGVLNWQLPNAGGLHRLDEAEEGFERFLHDPGDPASLSHNRVRTITLDSRGDLWIGTWGGLNRRRSGGGGFDRYRHDPADPATLAYDDVMDLREDAAGNLWVATIGGGLDRYDPEADGFAHIPWTGSEYLMSLATDTRGRLWVATLDDGLAVLEPGAPALRAVDLGPDAGASRRIDDLAVSSDGVLWLAGLATEDGAGRVLRMDLEAPPFAFHDVPNLRTIAEDETGDLWIGSGARLRRIGTGTGAAGRSYDCPGLGPTHPQHWLSTIVAAPDGTLWLGYYHVGLGLCRLDPGAEVPVPVSGVSAATASAATASAATASAATGSDATASAIPPLRWVSDLAWFDDRLWIASDGNLVALDPASGTLEVVREASRAERETRRTVWNLETDARGDLWIATADGVLSRRRAGSAEVERYELDLPGLGGHDFGVINAIRPRRDGTAWLATDGSGLCAFDPGEAACALVFDTESGLPSDYVMDVIEHDGRLWVAMLDALTELDPHTGRSRDLSLPPAARGGRFRAAAGVVTRAGEVYFGSSVGALGFRIDEAGGNGAPPVARITRIETVGGDDVDARRAGPLELSSGRNDLVFEYLGLHYADPAANRYAYRVDGLDDAWRNVGSQRRVRLTNLGPGGYVFRVRAASANGVWSDEASFGFRILSPWWRRPWALALWTLLAFGSLVAVRRETVRRRELATAIEREQAEARRLNELAATRSRLFANLSHEYRTPLALILGQIEATRADAASGGTGAGEEERTGVVSTDHKLEMAERQTRELQRLTDELLELSRLEAGVLELDWHLADVVPLVRGTVAAFHSAAESAGVDLRLEAPKEPVRVRHDPEKMRRIITNLVANALKFTSAGGDVVVRIEPAKSAVTEEDEAVDEIEDFLRISVSDTGIGIAPGDAPRIFDRFYRAAADGPHDRVDGTGIGLSLVRDLVELHGGTISVDSEPGAGTRFDIRLPAPGEAEMQSDRAAQTAGDSALDPTLDPGLDPDPEAPTPDARESDLPIVLVVEDHPDMRAYLAQELADACRVEEAADGAAGLARAIEIVPDLVITDVVMPGLDGYELVRRLRADERTSHVPIIMLTGRTSEDARLAGLESGVDEYLPKPFSARILRTRVRKLLEIRRMLRARYSGEIWLKPEEVEVPSLDARFLEKVAGVIEERMSDGAFTVEELAASVHMSRSQLHRKLTALLGRSPGAVIRGMRLQRAADLIVSGSRQLGQIAYDTGFSDQAHFSRSFKNHFGCTPSTYRNRSGEAADETPVS